MIFWGPNASQHVALYLGNGEDARGPAVRIDRPDLRRAMETA